MTDFCKVNNVYYDINIYNPTSSNTFQAEQDNKLLFPLLNQANDYSVSLAKAKIPLDLIPLTQYNIPLKSYEIGLKIGNVEETAYVRQVNANQDNFLWNIESGSPILKKYTYSSTGTLTFVSSQDLSIPVPNINIYNYVIDDYQNIFVIAYNGDSPNTIYIIDENNNLLQTLNYSHISFIYIDRGQNLYICDNSTTPTVYIYGMNNAIGSVNLTLKTTLTQSFAGNPLLGLVFCVADDEIVVGYNSNEITVYDSQYNALTDKTLTQIDNLQNVANINKIADSFIVSNSDSIFDKIFGISGNNIYDVNDNIQLSNSNNTLAAPSYLSSGYLFMAGTDNNTYLLNYPVSNPPQAITQVNAPSGIKASYSKQKKGNFYGLGLSNTYDVWNFKTPPTVLFQNNFTNVGEFYNAGTSFLSLDNQSTTNKLLAVCNNNLYISTNPIAPLEYTICNVGGGINKLLGTDLWDASFNQTNYLISQNLPFNNDYITGVFKRGGSYWVAENTGSNCDLVQYDIETGAETNRYVNFDNNMLGFTYLSISDTFIYTNNSNQSKHYNFTNPPTLLQTLSGFSTSTPTRFYELDNSHIALSSASTFTTNIDIYNYSTPTAPINTVNLGSNTFVDLAVNYNDTSSGLVNLYYVEQDTFPYGGLQLGNTIKKISFTNNYINNTAPTLVYTASANRYITFLEAPKNAEQLVFIECDCDSTPTFSNYVINTLFQVNNYSSSTKVSSPYTFGATDNLYIPYKSAIGGVMCLNHSTASTYQWTQINTASMQFTSACVSRFNPNLFYAINQADNKIYKGLYNSTTNTCIFTQLTGFTGTYTSISCKLDTEIIIDSTLYLYGLQSQNLITSLALNGGCGSIARNVITNQYISSTTQTGAINYYDSTNLSLDYSTTLNQAYRLFSKNGSDIDIGNYPIYNMSVLIDAINAAFLEATQKINQAVGSGTITTAPSISLNYTTGLCTLSYPSVLTQSNNGLLFSNTLLNIIYFQNSPDTLSSLFLVKLNSQTETITQNIKTIQNFNLLDKILFRSDTMFVVGAYFGINNSNNIFFDIDCPTSDWTENIGQTLYFQPNFLRTYFLRSNLSLDDIEVRIYYEYRDGTQYQLYIPPNQNVSLKLQYIKKF